MSRNQLAQARMQWRFPL